MSERILERPQYFVPALGQLYERLEPYAYPLIRATAGAMLLPHGAQKLFGLFGGGGLSGTAQFFAGNLGLEPGLLFALIAAIVEFGGGLALILGLFTRPFALAVAVQMAYAAFVVHLAGGFFWNQGGFEYPLFWGLVALAITIKGGGRLSLDRAIGREF
jgi:putative oxidoreductase